MDSIPSVFDAELLSSTLLEYTRLAIPEGIQEVIRPLVTTDDLFEPVHPHYVMLKMFWFMTLIGTWVFHVFMMIGPMHFWGLGNVLLILSTVLFTAQSFDATFLMIDWAWWLRGPKFIRHWHLLLAYIGAAWWLGSALGEILFLLTGTSFMSSIS